MEKQKLNNGNKKNTGWPPLMIPHALSLYMAYLYSKHPEAIDTVFGKKGQKGTLKVKAKLKVK